MRRWSELAERLAATTRTSEKTALLADYLRTLTPDELPIAAVFLTGRPFAEADQRAAGLGWSAIATAITSLAGVTAVGARRGIRPVVGPRASRSPTCSREAGHAPPPESARRSPRWPPRSPRSRPPRARPASRPILRDLLARSRPGDGQVHRQGPRRRPPDRASRGSGRGRHRQGVRPPARRRQVGRDARRRRRPARRRSPATTRSRPPSWPCSIRSSSCSRRRPRTPPRSSTRLGPEVWVEDKYDGIRAQLHKRGSEVRLYSRDLHDVSGAVTRRSSRRPRPLPGTASSMARSSPGATGPSCRSSRCRPGSAGSRRRPRSRPRSRSSTSPSTRSPSGPGTARPVEPLLRAPLAERRARARRPRPAVGGRRRPLRPLAPRGRRRRRRARGGLRRRARPPQRGPDGQGPDERLLARAGAGWAG